MSGIRTFLLPPAEKREMAATLLAAGAHEDPEAVYSALFIGIAREHSGYRISSLGDDMIKEATAILREGIDRAPYNKSVHTLLQAVTCRRTHRDIFTAAYEKVSGGNPSFSTMSTCMGMLNLEIEFADMAQADAASRCIQLLRRTRANDKAAYAAVLCVGRWGELCAMAADARKRLRAAEAHVKVLRENAAIGAERISALVPQM